jgi:cation transport regulator ChaC
VSAETLWIFGYGSLVWRPAFPHLRACPASISGFSRRFWQGSTDHRGLPGSPGRVATLVAAAESSSRCWGTAYEVPRSDPDGVLAGLDDRERGGYDRLSLRLSIEAPRPEAGSATHSRQVSPAIETEGVVYIAGPENGNYLGPAPVDAIASQVAACSGPSGPNREYVFELARSLRQMGAVDEHVFEVDAALRALLQSRAGMIGD